MRRFHLVAFLFSFLAVAQGVPSPKLSRAPSSKKTVTSSTVDGALRYVENSGICETTEGVNQYSGYVDIGTNQHMWFWFFEARNNPETAPFALWLNGGPGCSSMIGLFQEHGPCRANADGTGTVLNPYSWNEYANMIYVDQPIGTGFSYGTDTVTTTYSAAPQIWTFLQLLFTSREFSQYQSRSFALWTESYGGHYGPEFASYFQSQNAGITNGTVSGVKINLMVLGINNAWLDPTIQNEAYYDFAQRTTNGYLDMTSARTLRQVYNRLYGSGGCLALSQTCDTSGTNRDCGRADDYCNQYVFSPLLGNLDAYDIMNASNVDFPPESYTTYLANAEVRAAIGAESSYSECSDSVSRRFVPSADDARSFLPELSSVVQTGLRTIIWAGDQDYICNWLGNYRAITNMTWGGAAEFNAASFSTLELHSSPAGEFINVGNFSFVKITGAGHEVAAYTPEIALQVFEQVMQLREVSST